MASQNNSCPLEMVSRAQFQLPVSLYIQLFWSTSVIYISHAKLLSLPFLITKLTKFQYLTSSALCIVVFYFIVNLSLPLFLSYVKKLALSDILFLFNFASTLC